YEPENHLTNGSLHAGFAGQFASNVKAVTVMVAEGSVLESLHEFDGPVLVKVDTEGAEAQVLNSLQCFICSRRPDMVIEVLPQYEPQLNALSFLKDTGYRFFRITPGGLIPESKLIAGAY